GIKGCENRDDDANTLKREPKVVAQQLRKRAHLAVDTHFLQLSAAKKLKGMLEHTRHLPCRRRNPRDRHDRTTVNFQDLIGAIVNNGVSGRSAPVARD